MYLVNVQNKSKQTNIIKVCASSVELVKCIQDYTSPDSVIIVSFVEVYE